MYLPGAPRYCNDEPKRLPPLAFVVVNCSQAARKAWPSLAHTVQQPRHSRCAVPGVFL